MTCSKSKKEYIMFNVIRYQLNNMSRTGSQTSLYMADRPNTDYSRIGECVQG